MNRTTLRQHLTLLSLSARHLGDNSPDAIEALTGLWWRKVGHLPDGLLVPAFELALDTCKFFPSIAEFNDLLASVAKAEGGVVGGASAWEAMERDMFRAWSEAGDRVMLADGRRYPWPDDRSRAILRDQMNLTVRMVAMMHPKDYDATRARFVKLYDEGQATERAQQAAGLVPPTPLRQIGD